MGVDLIFAIGVSAFLLIFLFSKLDDKEHFGLRLLILGFMFYLLILVGKAAIDEQDHCIDFIKNQTTINENVTEFGYDRFCVENTLNTSDTFFVTITRLFWLFMIYMFVFIIFKILSFYGKLPPLFMKFLRK